MTGGIDDYRKWSIFSCVHLAMKYCFNVWPDRWDLGGHCPFTAITGALLTEAVSGFSATPQCATARLRWADGTVGPPGQSGHRYYVIDTPKGQELVDLRIVLMPERERAADLMGKPPTIPPFVWGQCPEWLVLDVYPGATQYLIDAADDLRRPDMYGQTMRVAAQLLQAGLVDGAARLIAARFHWLQRQEQ